MKETHTNQQKEQKQLNFDFNSTVDYKQSVIEDIYSNTNKGFRFSVGEFITWMGGKSRVAKELASLLHKIPHTTFVDCFIGGGAEFFAKNKVNNNIINDRNDNLINLYKQTRENIDDLMFFLYNTLRSQEQFKKWKLLYKSKDWNKLDNIERAGIFYYLISMSVNSDENTMGYSLTGKQGKKFGNDAFFATLIRARNKLQGVQIYNKDFGWVIEKYNKKSEKDKVLFFFDPPYFVTNTGKYYKHNATSDLHKSLLLNCRKINKQENYFFITYDNVWQARNMYKDFNLFPLEIDYGSAKRSKATEIIITNSNFDKQGDLFD